MSTSLNSDKLPLTRSEAHTPAMRPQAGEALAQDGSTEPGAARPVAGGMLHPFTVRNFTLLFSGQTVSIIGDALYAVALPWLILTTGGSAEALGLVLAAYGIPRVGSMLVGGWLSDRLRPRRLMLIADTVRMLLVGILAALALWGHPALWQICALAVPLVSWRRIHARLHVHLAGDAEQRGPASRQRADDVFDAGREPGGVGLRGRGRGRVHRGRGSGHRRGYLLRFGGFARTDAHSPPRHTQQTRGRRKPGASLSQHPGARCAGQLLALSAHLALDSGHPADVHRDRPLFGRIDRGGAAHAGPRSHARGREQLWHHPGSLGGGRARWEPLLRHAGQTHTQRAGHPPGWPDRGRLDRASPHLGVIGAMACMLIGGVANSVITVLLFTAIQLAIPRQLMGRVMGLLMFSSFGLYPLSVALAGVLSNQFGPAILFPFGGLLLGLVMVFGMTQRALREI